MLRPGGFPEYSPSDQKIFDTVQDIVRQEFELRNFQHIRTPAVERNDVLLKGGETVANEIFGLVGLKDFEKGNLEQAKKDYSLHFDLTVPFARYTLDHIGEIVFPFKRYQMQPVWRGERQQRGRFKEFWQCDVDSIWRAGTDVGARYGVETIATLQSAIKAIFIHFSIQKSFRSHIAHIGLTKAFLGHFCNHDETQVKDITNLLDKYYKLDPKVFAQELNTKAGAEVANIILKLIETKDYNILESYNPQARKQLDTTIRTLNALGANVIFDITIVRGLGYYTDIVFETFLEDEIGLGSICSGGGYEEFTKFLDPKQIFSGIGGSIGLSRMMEIILEQANTLQTQISYLFLNFSETFDNILALYTRFLNEGKTCELYPTPTKFGKQLEYADKKGISNVIILGTSELEKNIYIEKDLKTGEQKEQPLNLA